MFSSETDPDQQLSDDDAQQEGTPESGAVDEQTERADK